MSARLRTLTATAFAVAVVLSGQLAHGEEIEAREAPSADEEPLPREPIIQQRRHDPKHEFRLSLAYLPQDPFYKAVGPDLAYQWHKGEYFSWEVLRISAFTSLDSELRQKLRNEFDANDDPYEKPQFMALSHIQYKPFYGRYTVMNRGVLHQEVYFTTGGGMIGWAKPENGLSGGGARPTADFGFGFRWYANDRLSVKLELLEQFFMRSDGSVGDQFYLTLGGSFVVPRKPRPARSARSDVQ